MTRAKRCADRRASDKNHSRPRWPESPRRDVSSLSLSPSALNPVIPSCRISDQQKPDGSTRCADSVAAPRSGGLGRGGGTLCWGGNCGQLREASARSEAGLGRVAPQDVRSRCPLCQGSCRLG